MLIFSKINQSNEYFILKKKILIKIFFVVVVVFTNKIYVKIPNYENFFLLNRIIYIIFWNVFNFLKYFKFTNPWHILAKLIR